MIVNALETATESFAQFGAVVFNIIVDVEKSFGTHYALPVIENTKSVIAAFKPFSQAIATASNLFIQLGQTYLKYVTAPIIDGVSTVIKYLSKIVNAIPDRMVPGIGMLKEGLDAAGNGADGLRNKINDLADAKLTISADDIDKQFAKTLDGLDNIEATLKKMPEAFDGLKISPDQVGEFFDKVRAKLKDSKVKEELTEAVTPDVSKIKEAQAAMFGSKDAANIVYQAAYGDNGKQDKQLEVAKQSKDELVKAATGIGQIVTMLGNKTAFGVI